MFFYQKETQNQTGFTLVELAIVMTIIGLLIGGILKGQELMQNARVTATISQVKSYEAASITFLDKYSALPGDLVTASERLPDCDENCDPFMPGGGNNIVGNSGWLNGWDTQVTSPMPLPPAAESDETMLFWVHLSKADLISGVTTSALTGDTVKWGDTLPAARFPGGFVAGYGNGAFSFADAGYILSPGAYKSPVMFASYRPALDFARHAMTFLNPIRPAYAAGGGGGGGGGFGGPGCPGGGSGPGQGAGCGIGGGGSGGSGGGGSGGGVSGAGPVGLILVLVMDPFAGGTDTLSTPNLQPLTPALAARIDRKMDDGLPASGYVHAYGLMDSCFTSDSALAYNETVVSRDCGLVFSIAR